MLSAVAVRVFQLRVRPWGRRPGAAPAGRVATAAEVHVVRRLVGQKRSGLTVRDFVRGVARLGGFLGRQGDGEPGIRALWRGYANGCRTWYWVRNYSPPQTQVQDEPPQMLVREQALIPGRTSPGSPRPLESAPGRDTLAGYPHASPTLAPPRCPP